jgi:predicted DNA-binding transcriptional regulator YafY
MAIIKNAYIRYKVLDGCFSNPGKKYFFQDLIDECNKVLLDLDSNSNGISTRQIREDIAFMKSKEGWNIELGDFRDGKKMYYRYINSNFSINNMPLNALEIEHLKEAAGILSQFKGLPQFKWMNEILPKLNEKINNRDQNNIIMDFDNNEYLKGIENLGELYNSILYKKVLKIRYKPFEQEEISNIIFHPYFLKQYNNRWFVFGYNPEKNMYNWNLAIDRIIDFKESKTKYQQNTEINWSIYFEDIIGVTKPSKGVIESVKLEFFGKTANYIFSKPIHESQVSKWINQETLSVTLKVFINYELERTILSYSDSVRIISPKSLQVKIFDKLNNAVKTVIKN